MRHPLVIVSLIMLVGCRNTDPPSTGNDQETPAPSESVKEAVLHPAPKLQVRDAPVPEPRVEIRIRNATGKRIVDLTVAGERYTTVNEGEVTEYRHFGGAYRYASVRATFEDGTDASIRPRDFMGETPLTAGRYTYVLTTENGELFMQTRSEP